jgi:hypothetical protein
MQSSLANTAFLSASSNGPKVSHSVPSFGEAAGDEPQRTFCTAPSVSRGGGAGGANAVVAGLDALSAPALAEALAAAAAPDVLVEGLRHK